MVENKENGNSNLYSISNSIYLECRALFRYSFLCKFEETIQIRERANKEIGFRYIVRSTLVSSVYPPQTNTTSRIFPFAKHWIEANETRRKWSYILLDCNPFSADILNSRKSGKMILNPITLYYIISDIQDTRWIPNALVIIYRIIIVDFDFNACKPYLSLFQSISFYSLHPSLYLPSLASLVPLCSISFAVKQCVHARK